MTDNFNHDVEIFYGGRQALQNVRASLCLFQIKFRAPRDDFLLVFDVVLKDFFKVEKSRAAVDESNHVDAEAVLHLRVLEQLIQNDLRSDVAAQVD